MQEKQFPASKQYRKDYQGEYSTMLKKEATDLGRRKAFGQLLGNVLVTVEEVQGHKHCSLDELERMESVKWQILVPQINRDYVLSVSGDCLKARKKNTQEIISLFPINQENTTVFNLINGKHNFAEITATAAGLLGWETNRSFQYVKEMVLFLLKLHLLSFQNPVDD